MRAARPTARRHYPYHAADASSNSESSALLVSASLRQIWPAHEPHDNHRPPRGRSQHAVTRLAPTAPGTGIISCASLRPANARPIRRLSAASRSARRRAATSRAMSGDGDTVEIKYRAFIPSPGPLAGPSPRRTFTATTAASAMRGHQPRRDHRHVDTRPRRRHFQPEGHRPALVADRILFLVATPTDVPGKPDWWLDLNAGATADPPRHLPGQRRQAPRLYRRAGHHAATSSATSRNGDDLQPLHVGQQPAVTRSPAIDADISVYLRRAPTGIQAMVVGEP